MQKNFNHFTGLVHQKRTVSQSIENYSYSVHTQTYDSQLSSFVYVWSTIGASELHEILGSHYRLKVIPGGLYRFKSYWKPPRLFDNAAASFWKKFGAYTNLHSLVLRDNNKTHYYGLVVSWPWTYLITVKNLKTFKRMICIGITSAMTSII